MKLNRSIFVAVLLAAPLACANLAVAQEHQGRLAAPASAELTDGEIKKVDKDGGKLTIKHGELKTLGMMPMTMVFKAADPALLDQAAVGAKVRFRADKINGVLTVTAIEVVQ